MEIRVTIGVYEDIKQADTVFTMNLPTLPAIGDKILLNEAMNRYAEQKCSEWDFPQGTKLNYVRCVAYESENTPIVMLSYNQTMFRVVNVYSAQGKHFSVLTAQVPCQGDNIILAPEQKMQIVQSVTYNIYGDVFIQTVDEKEYEQPQIYVRGTVNAQIFNKVPVDIQNKCLDVSVIEKKKD